MAFLSLMLFSLFLVNGCAHKTSVVHQIESTSSNEERNEATENKTEENEVGENAVPSSLTTLGEAAEDGYDTAKTQNWQKLNQELNTIKQANQNTLANVKNAKQEQSELQQAIASLENNIRTKNRLKAMEDTNKVTLIAIRLTSEYPIKTPNEVTLLDYQGRELEIGAEEKDLQKLKTTAQDIQKTWTQLQPQVKAHGGEQEAQKFNQLVQQLQTTKTLQEYAQLANPILEEVDNLEKVFTR